MSDYRYPFTPFPNSWYRVCYSHEVQQGEIKRCSYLGEDLVVFRGENGEAHVIDAFCPHLGADFSVGGKVVGNNIACPFHDWRFSGDGKCQEIPYCEEIPKKARVKSWPVIEKDGLIFFYYHAEELVPEFDIPDGPCQKVEEWNDPMIFNFKFKMHIQEVAENAVDTSHFPVVHAYAKQPEITKLEFNGASFRVELDSQRFGLNFIGNSPITIEYTGFGVVHSTVIGRLTDRFAVELGVILTSTPIDRDTLEISIMARHKKSRIPLWDKLVMKPMLLKEIPTDFKNDGPIWESKKYLSSPVLCQDDGPIGKVRKWAKQFYSDYEEESEKIPLHEEHKEVAI